MRPRPSTRHPAGGADVFTAGAAGFAGNADWIIIALKPLMALVGSTRSGRYFTVPY